MTSTLLSVTELMTKYNGYSGTEEYKSIKNRFWLYQNKLDLIYVLFYGKTVRDTLSYVMYQYAMFLWPSWNIYEQVGYVSKICPPMNFALCWSWIKICPYNVCNRHMYSHVSHKELNETNKKHVLRDELNSLKQRCLSRAYRKIVFYSDL